MRGTAYTFGDHVNTDVITPSDYFDLPIEGMADHIFEPVRPGFADELDEGDVVVAGENFGQGSARETAPAAVKAAGISAVVAESFARIFYRNAIAIGLPAVTCRDVRDSVSEGDTVRVDLDAGTLDNVTTGETLSCERIPESIQTIFDEGGLVEHYNNNPGGLRMH